MDYSSTALVSAWQVCSYTLIDPYANPPRDASNLIMSTVTVNTAV